MIFMHFTCIVLSFHKDFKTLHLLEIQVIQVYKTGDFSSTWLISNTSNVLLFCSGSVINTKVWRAKKKKKHQVSYSISLSTFQPELFLTSIYFCLSYFPLHFQYAKRTLCIDSFIYSAYSSTLNWFFMAPAWICYIICLFCLILDRGFT